MIPQKRNIKDNKQAVDNLETAQTNIDETISLMKQFYKRVVDLSSLSESYYYPVVGDVIPRGRMHRMTLSVHLDSGTKPSWSSHALGYSCTLDVLEESDGWGTTSGLGIVLEYSYSFASSNPISYSQMTNSGTPVFWCRGGGKYYIYSDYDSSWYIKTSEYTIASQTVAPRTSLPALEVRRSTIYANVNGTVGTDTGWVDLSLNSGIGSGTLGGEVHSGVKIRNINNHVFIKGIISGTYNGSSPLYVATIPSGYRPSKPTYVISTCAGYRLVRVGVEPIGNLFIDWIKNISDGSNHTSNVAWIQVDIDYWID